MSFLRNLANSHLHSIVRNTVTGFGWSVVVTAPDGATLSTAGLTNDIGVDVDPETGLNVSGRTASVSLSINDLLDSGISIPEGEVDQGLNPYTMTFSDVSGVSYDYYVTQTMPDRTIGLVVCKLGMYIP